MELFLHDGDNLLPVGGIRRFFLRCSNQPLADVLRSHSQWAAQAVQAKPAHCPSNLFILQDGVIHQETKVSHRDRLSWRWNVLVDLDPFLRHFGDGHSGWGWGAVHCVLIQSLHPDPCLKKRGVSDASRESTTDPALDAHRHLSSWIPSLIMWLKAQEIR